MSELFSAFGIDWRLLLAQAINFAIVLVALWYFLYKPVLAMMTKRQELVAKGVADAELAGEKLSGADAQAQARITEAEKEAAHTMSSARETANAEKTRLLQEAEARAAHIARDADARAQEVSARALRESEQDIARLATLAAEKILRQKYD